MDDRIAARRRALHDEQRTRRRRRVLWGLLAAVLVGAVVGVERGGLVDVDHVRIVGLDRLDRDEVVAAMDLPRRATLVTVRTRVIAQQVARLPLVRTASASRTGPDTITVTVVERVPSLAVRGASQAVLVDRDGVVIDLGSLEGLPVVELDARPPEPGASVAESPALHNAWQVWRGLSGPMRAQTRVYEASADDELTLVLDRGVRIRFGRAERIDEKVRAIGVVLDDLGDTPVDHVDVRAPSSPVVVVP